MVRICLVVVVSFNLVSGLARAAEAPAAKTWDEAIRGLEKLQGFFPLYWDAKKGRMLLEVDRWDKEFLYLDWLATGVGSNDIGLDRGQLGHSAVVSFQRSGPRVLLVQTNYGFRADSDNADERQAVREAFASSVLWGFDVEADGPDGRVLVDASKFFLRDARDVAGEIKKQKQGVLKLEPSRSAFYLSRTKNFPKNTEVEVTLTFVGEEPGPWLTQVVPAPQAVTVREHHSLIELPDRDYRPRRFDPRSGYFYIQYMDFATPIAEPLQKRLIIRHRLKKKDPSADSSEPVKPLVYYVDRGAPEPIRSALVEGARWWAQAFDTAGFQDAFRVELLPAGADPMDVRYNVIQWVHRLTRGWAYGNAVVDPRTGEIIKGQVTMDSQRARQVHRLLEAFLAFYEEGKPADPRIEETVLARIRQLSAHEVGHTLGLAHNFAASYNDRASVMDYPHPWIELTSEGSFDVSSAYARGIGEWDKIAIRYGYSEFAADADENRELDAILRDAQKRGFVFMTDQDARPEQVPAAHPRAHLWDNGKDPVAELDRVMSVRERALDRFSEKLARPGQPLSDLEDKLVLVYMYHRYQVEAAVTLLGGADYTYALRGDGQKIVEAVPAKQQRRALEVLLSTIRPKTLAIPERVLAVLPPPAYGHERTRESFPVRTRPVFDALAGPECAAQLVVSMMLDPARSARLVQQHALDAKQLGLEEVMDRLLKATWKMPEMRGYEGEIQRVVDEVVLYHLMTLAANGQTAPQVRAAAFAKLADLERWLDTVTGQGSEAAIAQRIFALARIRQFLKEPGKVLATKPIDPPPGEPIGSRDECGQ
jgi:hypothetical protein